MNLSRVSSFSQRPDFPKGLKVMVVDPDSESLKQITVQLRDCNYDVRSCSTEEDATVLVDECSGDLDVLLCQTSIVAQQSKGLTRFLEKIKDVPLVLMGENCTQQQKMTGVKLGAVDFLEKPLSELKLRNIWQHTVRKMLRAQKHHGRSSKSCKDDLGESDQRTTCAPSEKAAPSCTLGVTTRLHRARQQESTGSSEAIESSADGKESTAEEPPQSKALNVRKADAQRKVATPVPHRARPLPVSAAQPSPTAPPQQQYYMQGMPAPLPGCVWGLPMLPPPVAGLMGTPAMWPSAASMPFSTQQPHMQAISSGPQAVMMSAGTSSSRPQQVYTMQPCWQPAVLPNSNATSQPLTVRHLSQANCHTAASPQHGPPPSGIKTEGGSTAQHTSTTGSNSNSEATWQALDWGMDDMFLDTDTALDAKLDLSHLINSGLDDFDVVENSMDTGSKAPAENAKHEELSSLAPCDTWLEDHSMLENDLDASFADLDYLDGPEYHDDLGMSLHKSPSLIDMIDHLCANDPL